MAAKHTPETIEAEIRLARAAAESAGSGNHETAPALPVKDKTPDRGPARRGPIAVAAVAIVFAFAYAAVLSLFLREGHPTLVLENVPESATPIEAHFIAIDLVKEIATMTITPSMSSPLVAERGKLITDVTVEIELGTSLLTHTFKRGDVVAPWIAVIPLEFGDQLEYPFDRHGGDFQMRASRKNAEGTMASLEIDKITHGFSMFAREKAVDGNTQLDIAFEIKRSPAVLFLALLAMISLTLVVVAALVVAYQVAFGGKKTEFSMMTWIAALLFVVPAVRNGLPGGPPHGAFVDIALFFWLHIFTVLALLTVVWRWNKQK